MVKKFWSLTALLIAFVAVSCNKEMQSAQPVVPIDSIASYKIIITGTWKAPGHTVPAGNHFTPFIGMVHNSTAHLFQLDAPASKGIEAVAEDGNSVPLQNEIAGYLSGGNAFSKFVVSLPDITGTDSAIIRLGSKNSLVSFASMIAPSPDWFVGMDSYNLIQKNAWVKEVTITAAGYDAGTEDGDVFGYNNPETTPQQKVSYLTPANASVIANSNAVIAPFVTVRLIKQ